MEVRPGKSPCAASTAWRASAAVCSRPSILSSASSSDCGGSAVTMGTPGDAGAAAGTAPLTCTPMDRRFTPAALKPARRDALAELGLASSVTSAAAGRWAAPATASSTAATVPGLARLGVPPPKKTEVTLQGRGWEAAGGHGRAQQCP